MAKGMTVSQIKMYEDMLKKDFAPQLRVLKARSQAMKENITVQVKKDMGIYEDQITMAKLKLQLDELKARVDAKTQSMRTKTKGGFTYSSPVDVEVERRLEESNAELAELEKFIDNLVREIQLSTAAVEVKAMFDKLQPEIDKWNDRIKALPPVKAEVPEEEIKLLENDSHKYY